MKLGKLFYLEVVIGLFVADISRGAPEFTRLISFDGTNGIFPSCALIQRNDGCFYGTTALGGGGFGGTVFRMIPNGHLNTLVPFGVVTGSEPRAGLTEGTDGAFYGTTSMGGTNWSGSIFRITPHGQFRNLHYFNDSSGFWPGGLLLGMDGSLYGMTQAGGENQYGTVFKLTPDGTLVTLYSFSGVDGGFEKFELVEGGDGNLYGTTMGGGTTFNEGGGVGTVFKMTPDGTLVWSYSFSGPDGVFPSGPLVEGLDGNFYGTTLYGGINLPSNASGTIYKITPNGVLTSIFSFTNQEGGIFDSNIDGANPSGALVQAKDGMLYGTTVAGGANGAGTIFKITTNGLLTTLYSFGTIMNGDGGCLDGAGSKQLTIGRDGNFYGTASMGGEYDNFGNGGLGTVFRLSIVRPVISIARPPFDGVTIKPEITISGKAKGDIASVFYQINGSEWAEATTGDNWTNWTANVALLVGVNVIRAYAVDTFEDFSQTNTVRYYRHNPVK